MGPSGGSAWGIVAMVGIAIGCGAPLGSGRASARPSAATASSSAPPPPELPSREDILRHGGVYPIPVPLTWKLINAEGEDETIPAIAGSPFHRILARGALLATESVPGTPPEAMAFARAPALYSAPPSAELLQAYAAAVNTELARQGLAPQVLAQQLSPCAVSEHPCVKLVIQRQADADLRTELRYLIRDRASSTWELVYLLRREDLPQWAPLLAEIDGR